MTVPHLLADLALLAELEEDVPRLDALARRWFAEAVLPFVACELRQEDARFDDAERVAVLLQRLTMIDARSSSAATAT